jgi:hypothetical protein
VALGRPRLAPLQGTGVAGKFGFRLGFGHRRG